VKDLQFKHLEFNGVNGVYLGSLASNKMLLFIGRSNTQKNSAPLQELLNSMILGGYLLIWPKSRNQLISELLTEKSIFVVGWLNKILGPNERPIKAWLRRFAKGLILISLPSDWGYFINRLSAHQVDEQEAIARQVIQAVGIDKSTFIMSHSAGGITASSLADEPNLGGIICFGYPFKHPDRDEESYRTEYLKKIQTPFLIIQGTKDEYGGIDVQNRYELSPYIKFEFVEATHEYENLSIDDWVRVTHKIEALLHTIKGGRNK